MKIVLILFSFLYLFAIDANVKYSFKNNRLYVYIASENYPRDYSFPIITIKDGELKFLGTFNYFYDEEYYVGEKYEVYFKNSLLIKPIKIIYNSKTYTTKPFKYIKLRPTPPQIYIFIKKQHSNFLNIIIISILLYLTSLVIIYNIKVHKIKQKIGFFDDDIKKFYYYVATNHYEAVEILNKRKNLFKKSINNFENVLLYVIRKEVKYDKFIKEFILFFGILIFVLILKVSQ